MPPSAGSSAAIAKTVCASLLLALRPSHLFSLPILRIPTPPAHPAPSCSFESHSASTLRSSFAPAPFLPPCANCPYPGRQSPFSSASFRPSSPIPSTASSPAGAIASGAASTSAPSPHPICNAISFPTLKRLPNPARIVVSGPFGPAHPTRKRPSSCPSQPNRPRQLRHPSRTPTPASISPRATAPRNASSIWRRKPLIATC